MNVRLTCEAGVSGNELDAMAQGIEAVGIQTPAMYGADIETVRTDHLPSLRSGQVDAESTLKPAHWVGDSVRLFATVRELGGTVLNRPAYDAPLGEGRAVLSITRLREAPEHITALTAHVLAHTVGLVSPRAVNHNRRALVAGHCINDCIMRPLNTRPLRQRAVELMATGRAATSGFCDDCAGQLHAVRLSY